MQTRTLLLTALCGAAVVVPASSASAAKITTDGDAIVFTAADGETNNVGLQPGYDTPDLIRIYVGSSSPVTEVPAGCDDHAADYGFVECPTPAAVRYELGDGDDWYASSSDLKAGLRITVDGGSGKDQLTGDKLNETFTGGDGDDILEGRKGNDSLDGGAGDDQLIGYSGDDHLMGGDGNDTLAPDGYEEPGADVVDGGAGIDTIEGDYSSRVSDLDPPVNITLGGGADDGRPGEGDDLRGVERLMLSDPGGRVVGSDADEYVKLHQVGANGELIGNGGNDELRGGDGEDHIDGGTGNDKLDGGYGDDDIVGGPGRDVVSADLATGDCGPLWCKYPYGNDVVDVRDGEADSVTCGAGQDKVVADGIDTVSPDCEQIDRAGGPAPGPGPSPAPKPKPTDPDNPVTPVKTATAAVRLRTALKRGLTVKLDGVKRGTAVKALAGGRLVARGKARSGGKATLRFTKAAKRSLARKRTVKLTIAAGAYRGVVTLAR
jgi:Ca2+-binding RTX toxin-like protein